MSRDIENDRRKIIPNLSINLAHHALKKALATLAMTSKETNLSRIEDFGHVIALLEQETVLSVDKNCTCKFMEK